MKENHEQLPEPTLKELEGYFKDVLFGQIPKSELRRKLAFKWIPQIENNVLAFVYLFAAVLVVTLGLRGMGEQMPFDFLKDSSGRLSSWIILVALFIEFVAILILALTMYFKPEEVHSLVHEFRMHSGGKMSGIGVGNLVNNILKLSGNLDEGTSQSEILEKHIIVEQGLHEIFQKLSRLQHEHHKH